jgi:hypothetical protein
VHQTLDELLYPADAQRSALDVDVAQLGWGSPVAAAARTRPVVLTHFDVADEASEDRRFARRRALGIATGATLSTLAVVGSVALGF